MRAAGSQGFKLGLRSRIAPAPPSASPSRRRRSLRSLVSLRLSSCSVLSQWQATLSSVQVSPLCERGHHASATSDCIIISPTKRRKDICLGLVARLLAYIITIMSYSLILYSRYVLWIQSCHTLSYSNHSSVIRDVALVANGTGLENMESCTNGHVPTLG